MKKKILKVLVIVLGIVLCATFSFATEVTDLEILEKANITEMIGENNADVVSSENAQNSDIVVDGFVNGERNIINGDSFEGNEEVSIDYDVDGNLYVLAEQLDIKSCHVDGNAFILAEDININNLDVTGSIYILGKNISLEGNSKDMYALGENVIIKENSSILKNLNALGKNITISGSIGRDCNIKSSNINVENTAKISGILNAEVESEQIGTDAIINEKNIEHIQNIDVDEITETTVNNVKGFSIASSVFKAAIIIGILAIKNKFDEKSKNDITVKSVFGTAFSGIGALILIPILCFISICTVVGLGFGIILLILYFIFIYVSTSVASYEISKELINKFNINVNIFVKYLISVAFYAILKVISVYANIFVIPLILGICGMGYIWGYIFKNNKKVITEPSEIEKRIDEIE